AQGPLGDVLDIGAGRGQLGLCLLELGHVQTLSGFDFDERKIKVARSAAGTDARFDVGDATASFEGSFDTILLIDVLHYLSVAEQNRLLLRATRMLRPGGRILIREADVAPGAKSGLTRALEHIATRVGYNRVERSIGFRPLAEIVSELKRADLTCEVS